jgi:hypothetical protein
MASSDFHDIEKDTVDSESMSIIDLLAFLNPSSEILGNIRCFGLYFDRNIFDGWVKQPSPCCAAGLFEIISIAQLFDLNSADYL